MILIYKVFYDFVRQGGAHSTARRSTKSNGFTFIHLHNLSKLIISARPDIVNNDYLQIIQLNLHIKTSRDITSPYVGGLPK
ncbi:hypothetical protein SAMN05444506_104244 [Pseudomonas syringae]|nr:hypothetical protein SAMN05444506_104244 [Pseudomonas syringae]